MTNRRDRKGIYIALLAMTVVIIFGIGALSIDLSFHRLGDQQAQDVADAAGQAAYLAYRETGDVTAAEAAAQEIVALNGIAGAPGTLSTVEFGKWDPTTKTFDTTSGSVNGSRVEVQRNDAQYTFARLLNKHNFDVGAASTSASQTLQVVLVWDITASWDKDDFYVARTAALNFLDFMHTNSGSKDIVGMSVYMNRYGWEFTPFTLISESAADSTLVYDPWSAINIGSVAGTYRPDYESNTSKHLSCDVFGNKGYGNGNPWGTGWCTSGGSCYEPSKQNDHSEGNCWPDMPLYFSDEGGTDHAIGLEMARVMFEEVDDSAHEFYDPFAYRAVIILTDGEPSSIGTEGSNTKRKQAGYTEERYRETKYSHSRNRNQIKAETANETAALYDDLDVNVWFVTFKHTNSSMPTYPKGDGWYQLANTPEELIPIFEKIAQSLPQAIVE